jgi:hypothetical protein
MSKIGIIYCKKMLILLLVTICGFVYLEQRMLIIKLSYQNTNLEQALKKEQRKMEKMRYQIASLENPYRLEKEFFVCNPQSTPASSVRVVRIPYWRCKIHQPASAASREKKVLFAEEIP